MNCLDMFLQNGHGVESSLALNTFKWFGVYVSGQMFFESSLGPDNLLALRTFNNFRDWKYIFLDICMDHCVLFESIRSFKSNSAHLTQECSRLQMNTGVVSFQMTALCGFVTAQLTGQAWNIVRNLLNNITCIITVLAIFFRPDVAIPWRFIWRAKKSIFMVL